MSDCNNNCEAVAGLNEAAANLVQYSKLINSWLNGGSNQTVNVGGTNIPTLLGLACEIRQLVGVWPDGLTIKMDPQNKKIYVPLKPNSGVHVGNQGLYIDSSDFLQIGGGLAKDPTTGQLYVDFDQMPTSKFDAILETFRKGLRLPKYLTGNKNFYVDKNHANAADTLDEGRGESPSLPFKTIQACVNYVCINYSIGNYQARIIVADGTYNESLILPDFIRNSGSISIRSASGNRTGVTIVNTAFSGSSVRCTGGYWIMENMTIEHSPNLSSTNNGLSNFAHCINVSTAKITITGLRLRFLPTGTPTSNYTHYSLYSDTNAVLTISPGLNKTSLENNAAVGGYLKIMAFTSAGGNVTFSGTDDNSLERNSEVSGSFSYCCDVNGGLVTFHTGRKYKAGISCVGNQSGQRYRAMNGGRINTVGGGPDFFPGATAGTVESSTYSWYK